MRRRKSELQLQIDRVYASMETHAPTSPEYANHITVLQTLHKLKRDESREKLSVNTAVVVGGNLAGILVIVGYEHAHVITTKAIGMIRR